MLRVMLWLTTIFILQKKAQWEACFYLTTNDYKKLLNAK